MENPSENENKASEDSTDAAGGIPTKPDPNDQLVQDKMAELEARVEAAGDPEGSKPDPEADDATVPVPLYKCHKTVEAFKIAGMESLSNGEIRLIGYNADHIRIVGSAYVDKHHPKIDGYYVRYHDGYQSWSPAEAFENGYTIEAV